MLVNLWEEFNFGAANPDPAGGIMYSLRYDNDTLIDHRKNLVNKLETMGYTIKAGYYQLSVQPAKKISKHEHNMLGIMLEELSVLNDAIKFSNMGFSKYDNMVDMKNSIINSYHFYLENDKEIAADIINRMIPDVINRMYGTGNEFRSLPKQDKNALDELILFKILKTNKHYEIPKHDFFLVYE